MVVYATTKMAVPALRPAADVNASSLTATSCDSAKFRALLFPRPTIDFTLDLAEPLRELALRSYRTSNHGRQQR